MNLFDMDCVTSFWNTWLTDDIIFPALQFGLMFFALLNCIVGRFKKWRKKGSIATMSVERGEKSMGMLYGSFAFFSGVFLSLTFSVETAISHRALLSLLDIILVAYLCLQNGWARNKLLGIACNLSKVES